MCVYPRVCVMCGVWANEQLQITALERCQGSRAVNHECELTPPPLFISETHAHMWWALEHAGVWGSQMSHLPIQSSNIRYLLLTDPWHHWLVWCFFQLLSPPLPISPTSPASIAVVIHYMHIHHRNACKAWIPCWNWDENKAFQQFQTSCSRPMDAHSSYRWFIDLLTDVMSERDEDTCGGGAAETHGVTIFTASWLSQLKTGCVSTFSEILKVHSCSRLNK